MAHAQNSTSSHAWSRLRSKKYLCALAAALVILCYLAWWDSRPVPSTDNSQRVSALGGHPGASPGSPGAVGDTPEGSAGATSHLDAAQQPESQNQQQRLGPSEPAADRPKAIIIESRLVPSIIPIMLHFAAVLGPAWGMVLFTDKKTWEEPRSAPFQRLRDGGQLEVVFLPDNTALTDTQAVSQFLASPWIWEQVSEAQRVLLFQADSILCSRSGNTVENFFEYDMVGAPIAEGYGKGYNGGLSLRNPRAFLDIARSADFASSGHFFEDQFFFEKLEEAGAKLPDVDTAKRFSVEYIYYKTPLGYHQPARWHEVRMEQIEHWCPEVRLILDRRLD
ncbi:uncharacterized protein B0I36DRAFT_367466 [Microdochium trichocladiopsis]|uniref:DUF5672 domain-containing protein n=1 Tax=Microdochium trichocladiopsis TaxID=1682393 RepID=A0A9P8XW35_9PEZI|nr:uncharacterized protein B0I36DRAFT_367466 [Microdochium trichocladiopsis]KAH7021007.1 hypothetical protein B0I36DRAFT_367466 [Microdochium trichocladiopsis]